MDARQGTLLKLHFTVFIFGFTAIFGRLISLDEGPLVWYRMMIASIGLLVLPRFWRGIRTVKPKDGVKVALTGGIVAIHWVTFFGAIKFSNVSFALCMMATASFFTSLLEPLILRRPFNAKEILLGLLVLPGIFMVFQFSEFYWQGMILGLISAFLAALFGTINKTFAAKMKPIAISFLELATGFLILSLLLPVYFLYKPEATLLITHTMDILWLLILGIVCTTMAFIFSVDVLRELSAFTTALAINLEPIYGMILAILIFNENKELGGNFYLGAGLIVLAILLNGIIKNRK